MALLALLFSVPLWLVPPGTGTTAFDMGMANLPVMAFDALAEHASRTSAEVLRRHQVTLLGMGVLTGYCRAAPSIVWASGCRVCRSVCGSLAVGHFGLHAGFAFSSLWFCSLLLAGAGAIACRQFCGGRRRLCARQTVLRTGRAKAVQPPNPINSIEIYGSSFGLIIVGDGFCQASVRTSTFPKSLSC